MKQEFSIGIRQPFSENIAVVSQIGYIDLRVAYETGSVPADLEGVEGNFNGINEPSSIIGSPDDVFSAIRAKEAVAATAVATSTESPEGAGGA